MPPRQIWWSVLGWLAGAQLVIGVLGIIGVATFVDARTLSVGDISALHPAVVWHKWDALWYERIALHGYGYQLDDIKGQAAAGFFPLYPLTVGAVLGLLPGLSFFWTAATISAVSTLAALLLVGQHLTDGRDQLRRVLLVMLTSAGAFYLTIPYTEGLFLLLVVVTMVLTRRQQYVLAGVCGGLAAITRVHGLPLIAVPIVACLLDPRLEVRQRMMRAAAAAILFAVPFAIYLAYMGRIQGEADAFLTRQAFWSNATPYPFRAIVGLIEFPRRINGWLHGGYWALYVGLLIRYWRRLPMGEALFCAGALLVSTQQESFQGIYRYVTPMVPLAIALASDRADLRVRIVAFNLVFAVIMILAFVTNNRLAV